MWFRTYQENFSPNDEKFVRLTNGFNTNQFVLRRDDFLGVEDVDFKIESKKKSGQIREQMKIQFTAKLPIILQDPTVPKITKSLAFRYSLKLDGHSREMQQILNPYFSPEEIDARRKVKELDNNQIPEFTNPNVEWMTYYIIFQSAMDTEAKFITLFKLEEIMANQPVEQVQNQALQ
jgi:hypothetical protein